MIVDRGVQIIADFLAGRSEGWAGAIEIGVGEDAPSKADISLVFPFGRVPVEYGDFDPATNSVILRGTLKENIIGEIHEVGLFSSADYPEGEVGNRLLLSFTGTDTEYSLVNAVPESVNSRIGDTGYKLTSSTGTPASARGFLPVVGEQLNEYSGNDFIALAYYGLAGTPTVKIRLESTPTDYYQYQFVAAPNYTIEEEERQNFTVVGAPTWDTVNAILVQTEGNGEVVLDGLAVKDTVEDDNYGMVIRNSLSEPIIKRSGTQTEILVKMDITF